MTQATTATEPPKDKPTCSICSGPIRSNSKLGICTRNRTCARATKRADYAANKDHIQSLKRARNAAFPEINRVQRKRHYKANRERTLAKNRDWHSRNREYIQAKNVRYRNANLERERQRCRAYWEANKARLRQEGRARRCKNRDQINKHEKIKRRLRGIPPVEKLRGQLGNRWAGGGIRYCICCGRNVGWKLPNVIRRNKNGFRCAEHRYTQIKEDNHERATLRSSVA